MITVTAPAKINLTLEVLGKRSDGFHEIRSVMQTINLCDQLSFQSGDKLEFKSNSPGWVAEKSLVAKTACLLQETTPPKVDSLGAIIAVEKRIPLVGGLGGDSSDAAATLRGLNQLWELKLPKTKLLELACKLGSDVAFFLEGGTALVEGRGEIVTSLPPLPPMWFVLVIPDIPQLEEKTKRLYERLTVSHYTHGQITRQMTAKLREGGGLPADLLCNTFEKVAFTAFPGLSDYRERILKAGASRIHLAGSGPTLFTLHKDKTQAEKVYQRLNEQKIECYLAETFTPG
ncbi:MAG: 4-(cytidine 5'-diphospho)-2-C-methyl-D-erythritol kinase [Dehalococcoidales bacterium]|nr:4-(cytidine 5'-diphospho)-2-C-methyl-D-erythritol kinase [Dehalococcoidales bacterium]